MWSHGGCCVPVLRNEYRRRRQMCTNFEKVYCAIACLEGNSSIWAQGHSNYVSRTFHVARSTRECTKKNAVCIRNLLRCAIFATKHQSLQDECQVNKSKIPPDPVFGAKSSGFGLLSEHKLKNGTVLYDVLETSVNVVVRQKKTRQVGFQGFDLGTGFILLNKSKKKKDKPMLFMMNHQVSYHTFFDLHSPPHHSFPPLPSLILGRPEL